jgi:D-alanyl-D-alanine-carboxypeptidase/D-alanyl-D-alanine-endopeptidase
MISNRLLGYALALGALQPVFATNARAQTGNLSDSAIQAILTDRVAARRTMGIVVATLELGQLPHIYTAGVSGVAGLPLDGNTIFEIGSITKVFTNTILADMVKRGEVKLDDPISRYLPASVRVPQRNGKQITLVDLATQSSGLPRLPTNLAPADMNNPYADYSVKQLYDFLSSYTLTRDIGAQYEYSNLGMGLLGHVLSLRAHKSYADLVKERVLDPLGMHETGIMLTASMKSHVAQGFDANGAPQHLWDLPTLAGAGALRSSANDMLKFLSANLDSAHGPLGSAMAMARAPRRPVGSNNSIGLAWNTVALFGTNATWHNGGTGGFRTFIGLDNARHRGVIVLTNSTNSPDDIGFHILEPRVPLVGNVPAPRPRTEIAVDPSKLDALVGVYELAPNFQLAITKEGSSLFGQATGQGKVQMYAESETEFFLKVVDAQVTFVRDSAGKVDQIILHQNGSDIPGRRVK